MRRSEKGEDWEESKMDLGIYEVKENLETLKCPIYKEGIQKYLGLIT